MKTTDLKPSQVQRIDRLQMARYQTKKSEAKSEAIIVILFILWFAGCVLVSRLNQRHIAPELVTSLSANLDEQRPSVTVFAGEK